MDDQSGIDEASSATETDTALVALAPRWAVVGIFLLMAIGALNLARDFLVPVVLGFLLALVFSPVRRVLDKLMPSVLSALVIVGALLMLLLGGLGLLSGPVTSWIERAPILTATIEAKIDSLRGAADTVVRASEELDRLASGAQRNNDREVVVREGDGLAPSLALVAQAAWIQLMFVLALLFFLLSSGDMIYEKIVHVIPKFRDKKQALRIAKEMERKLSTYLFTITMINAGLGATIGFVMWLEGMPNALLFAAMAFTLNYVPYVGALFGAGVATMVGLVSLDSLSQAIVAGVSYFGLTSLFGQFVSPYFVGRQLRLNTVVVFLSVAMCAWLWSVVGMLVATPLLVTLRVFCEHIGPLQALGNFLSARGAEQENPKETLEGPS